MNGGALDVEYVRDAPVTQERVRKTGMELENLAMDRFLASVERKAFRMAQIATGDREEALDIVQEAMLNLVRKYRFRPQKEWRVLFFTIMHNRIRDWGRRFAVRRRFRTWLSLRSDPEVNEDGIETIPDNSNPCPEEAAVVSQNMEFALSAIHSLPLRQQQAFLLRAWEGLDTRETAMAMGCSEGSVKTHYSRALNALKEMLESGRK